MCIISQGVRVGWVGQMRVLGWGGGGDSRSAYAWNSVRDNSNFICLLCSRRWQYHSNGGGLSYSYTGGKWQRTSMSTP